MVRLLMSVMLLSLVAGCGGVEQRERSVASASPRPSPTTAVDNKDLSADELELAARDAFRDQRTGRATFDLRQTRGRLEWAGSSVRLSARSSLLSYEAIGSSSVVYVKYRWIKALTAEQQDYWDQAVGDKWIRSTERDEVVDFVSFFQRALWSGFTTGPGPAQPRSVPARRFRGTAAVGFTFPNEMWTVYVRRFGAPLPLRIDSGNGGMDFEEFGQDLEIEIPSVQQTLTYEELERILLDMGLRPSDV